MWKRSLCLVLVLSGCAHLNKSDAPNRSPAYYEAPLPYELLNSKHTVTIEDIKNKVTALKDASVAGFLQEMKSSEPELMKQATFMYRSGSSQHASFEFPRAIVFGGDGRMIFTFNGEGKGSNAIELLAYHPESKRFEMREIVFKKDGEPNADQRDDIEIETKQYIVSKADPTRCLNCHGMISTHPLFDHYPFWPGAYFSYGNVNEDLLMVKEGYLGNIHTFEETESRRAIRPPEPGQAPPPLKKLTFKDIFGGFIEISDAFKFHRNLEREQWTIFAPKLKADPRYSALSESKTPQSGRNLGLDVVLNYYNAQRVANLIVSSSNFSKIRSRAMATLQCEGLDEALKSRSEDYNKFRESTAAKIFEKEVRSLEDIEHNLGETNVVRVADHDFEERARETFGLDPATLSPFQTHAARQGGIAHVATMAQFRLLEREAPDLDVSEWSISTYEGNFGMREAYSREFIWITNAVTEALTSLNDPPDQVDCAHAAQLFAK